MKKSKKIGEQDGDTNSTKFSSGPTPNSGPTPGSKTPGAKPDQKEVIIGPGQVENQLSDYLHDEIRQCFDAFDREGTNSITIQNISTSFGIFNIEVDYDECLAIVEKIDSTGKGHIGFADFKREMYDIMLGGTMDDHLRMVFTMMDENKDGFIGVQDIINQFQKLGLLISEDEAYESLARLDQKGVGVVDFYQFKVFCDSIDTRKLMKF